MRDERFAEIECFRRHRADAEMATQQHRAGLEAVLAGAGVALVLAGHVHAYERSHPVCFDAVRADAPTFVTIGRDRHRALSQNACVVTRFRKLYYYGETNTGDGGNREQLYDEWPFHRDEKWSAFRNGTKYGFGVLTVYNDTTAKWEWLPNERRVADAVWLRNVVSRNRVYALIRARATPHTRAFLVRRGIRLRNSTQVLLGYGKPWPV